MQHPESVSVSDVFNQPYYHPADENLPICVLGVSVGIIHGTETTRWFLKS